MVTGLKQIAVLTFLCIKGSKQNNDILVADDTIVPWASPLGGWGSVQAYTERVISLSDYNIEKL